MVDQTNDPWKKDSPTENLNASQVFGISMIVGIVAIGIGAYIDNVWVTLSVPLGVMLYYINTVRNDNVSDVSVEQKADSVYYMGFIFTLVAMTASLVALSNSGEDLEFRPVVTNFGLALSTTILGLIIRIIWLQLSAQSLDDAESILKERIIRRTQELQEQTERIVASMTALSSQMASVAEPLQTNFEHLAKSFDISKKINENLEELNTSAVIISETFRSFANRLETMNPSVERLNSNVSTAVQIPLTINEDLQKIGTSSQNLKSDFESLSSSAVNIEPKIEDLNNKIALSIEYVNSAVSSLETTVSSTTDILENNKDSMSDTLNQSQQMLIEAQQSLIANARELAESNRQAQQELLQSAQAIAEGNKEIQDSLKATAKEIIDTKKDLSDKNQ
ncbi:hypothetical protein N9J68_03150 [Gammaproteobacteria bacterium]|nr:hypothetical protein [Gammaproteobacteria bacterium]MDA9011222.1 hypothetical protein [Gammaproteobacteria bacterium]MDA9118145.1 hypothetical protein [Gammaproteobacteria bacterium]